MSTIAPIARASERLLTEIERSVSRFPRAHKYLLGADLRKLALQGALLSHDYLRAARYPQRQFEIVGKLIASNDRLKLHLQTGHRLNVFSSRGNFELLAGLARDVGRQSGAMLRARNEHRTGQSPAAAARPERPLTLSTRSASGQEAKP
jgi:hypothetical protein